MTRLTLILTPLLLLSARAQTPASPKDTRSSPANPAPPARNPATLHTCNNPPLPSGLHDTRSAFRLRWSTPAPVTVGPFNMLDDTCVAKPYDLYVANGEPVTLTLDHAPGATCSATVAYKDDTPHDLGSVLGPVLTAALVPAPPGQLAITLPSAGIHNTAAAATLSCQVPATDTTTPVGIERKVTLHYGGPDLLTGSAGVSVSTLGKRIFGVTTVDTGAKNPDGTPITRSTVGITSSSNVQFVPMGFIHLNVAGNRTVNWNVEAGIGVNPNGGSTQVEYFVSPVALGLRGLFLSPGLQIARSDSLAGGFTLGEPVPSGFTVPTTTSTTARFGFTISYKPYK